MNYRLMCCSGSWNWSRRHPQVRTSLLRAKLNDSTRFGNTAIRQHGDSATRRRRCEPGSKVMRERQMVFGCIALGCNPFFCRKLLIDKKIRNWIASRPTTHPSQAMKRKWQPNVVVQIIVYTLVVRAGSDRLRLNSCVQASRLHRETVTRATAEMNHAGFLALSCCVGILEYWVAGSASTTDPGVDR